MGENDRRIDSSVGKMTPCCSDAPVRIRASDCCRLDANRLALSLIPFACNARAPSSISRVIGDTATSVCTGSRRSSSFLNTSPHLRILVPAFPKVCSATTTHTQFFELSRYSVPGRSSMWHSLAILNWQLEQKISYGMRFCFLAWRVRDLKNCIGGVTWACESTFQFFFRCSSGSPLSRCCTCSS